MTNSRARSLKSKLAAAVFASLATAYFVVLAGSAAAQSSTSTPPAGSSGSAAPTPLIQPAIEVPIPYVSFTQLAENAGVLNSTAIAEYVSGVYKFLIAISGILAAVMMMIGGFQYLTAGGDKGRVDAGKKRIENALVGLVLALGSYVLLWSINPDLVEFKSLQIQEVSTEEYPGVSFMSEPDYKAVTGKSIPSDGTIKGMVSAAAAQSGIDPCAFNAVVAKESGGKANAIGHDEDVPRTQVGARKKFFESGRTYKGQSLPAYSDAVAKDGSVRNDDTGGKKGPLNMSADDFGLDVRFSHGFGLGQVTLLKPTKCSGGKYGQVVGGRCFTIAELFDPQTNLTAAAMIYKGNYSACKGDMKCTFYRYAGSGCSARNASCNKMKAFNACKGVTGDERGNCSSWLSESYANCSNFSYK